MKKNSKKRKLSLNTQTISADASGGAVLENTPRCYSVGPPGYCHTKQASCKTGCGTCCSICVTEK